MDLGLEGRVALVAGASRGLGKAVAEALAAEGARLSLAARSPETLETTAQEIREHHRVEVEAVPTDVSDREAVERWVEAAAARFGAIDVLVANAGGPKASIFSETELDDWRSGLDLSLMSTIHLCRAVVPRMKAQGRGSILAITSVSVKQPVDGLILSNTARLGVVGLMKSMANELAPHGIRANVVCPGYTKTGRLIELAETMSEQRGVAVEEVYRGWTDAIPMGRLGAPEEFAAVVAFLASDKASYVTGTCLQVDGGHVKSPL